MCINKLRQSSANIFPLGIPKLSDKYTLSLSVSTVLSSDIDKKIREIFLNEPPLLLSILNITKTQYYSQTIPPIIKSKKEILLPPQFRRNQYPTTAKISIFQRKKKKIRFLRFQVSTPRKKEGIPIVSLFPELGIEIQKTRGSFFEDSN